MADALFELSDNISGVPHRLSLSPVWFVMFNNDLIN